MKNDNLIKFFSLVNSDKALKAKLDGILDGLDAPDTSYEDVLRACEGIISLAKTYDLHFTADEIFDFLEARVNALSDDELMSVAGGVNRQAVGAALSLLTVVSLMTGAISFIARNDNNKVANERDEAKLVKRISDDGDVNADAYKSAEKNKEFKGGQNNWKELLKDSKKSENKNGGASLKISNPKGFVNAKKSAKNELPAVRLKPQDKIKLDLKRVNKGQVGDAATQKENLKTGSTGVGSSAGSVARAAATAPSNAAASTGGAGSVAKMVPKVAAAKQEDVKNTPSPSTKRVEQNVRFGADNAKQEAQEGYFGLATPKSYTCFANAAIQQLYRNSVVRNAVLNANVKGKPCTEALQNLFKEMANGKIIGNNKDKDDKVKITMTDFFNKFPGLVTGKQEDSSEQYQEMIKKLEEEGLKFNEMKFETSFQTVIGSEQNVKKEWTKRAEASDFIIVSPADVKVSSLGELFDKDGVYDRQSLPGWNNDGKFEEPQDATKSTKISSFPKVLVFNINRTGIDLNTYSQIKVTKDFKIPEELTIAGNKYKLKTVTVQTGSLSGGHYYAYSRGSDDKWRELNDSRVTEINYKDKKVQTDVSKNATMATYEKVQ